MPRDLLGDSGKSSGRGRRDSGAAGSRLKGDS